MKYYAIIVAGGSGSRMKSDTPKQFLSLAGKPVLMHTIQRFSKLQVKPEIILALNAAQHYYWKALCEEYHFSVAHTLSKGGDTRFESVKNALHFVNEGLVAIQDGVRPLTDYQDIENCYRQAEEKGNAVLGVFSTDTIRLLTQGNISKQLDRNQVFQVQTPQVFESNILKRAYEQAFSQEFTDDASVVEKTGVEINLVAGRTGNIKITYPEDIEIAEAILRNKEAGK